MGVPRRNLITFAILEILNLDSPLFPLETTYEFLQRKKRLNRQQYRRSLRQLKSQGVLNIVKQRNKEFIRLTKKGQLKLLLAKPQLSVKPQWDGKWRVLVFDIPESSREVRDGFRRMLKQNNFHKLQASVFISPFPLSREGVRYLNESGLIKFIRIMRVDEMDNESDLKKKFNLL